MMQKIIRTEKDGLKYDYYDDDGVKHLVYNAATLEKQYKIGVCSVWKWIKDKHLNMFEIVEDGKRMYFSDDIELIKSKYAYLSAFHYKGEGRRNKRYGFYKPEYLEEKMLKRFGVEKLPAESRFTPGSSNTSSDTN